MKPIFNWDKATVFDIEGDGLLDEITKMHVLSFQMQGKDDVSSIDPRDGMERVEKMFKWHIDNQVPVIAHYGILFDIPALEKLFGFDLSELMVIDTVAVSWYLNTDRKLHGLDSFHEDYGIKKPEIDDWKNLTYEEYRHRCEEDVKINKALWEDLKGRLIEMYTLAQAEIDAGNVGGTRMSADEEIFLDQFKGDSVENAINRILTFLMFKMDCARLQEKTEWDLDMDFLNESLEGMYEKLEKAKGELESVMPKIPKYSDKKKPAKPFKANGEKSAAGLSWDAVLKDYQEKTVDEFGTRLVIDSDKEDCLRVLKKYEEPNAGSSDQIKALLFSKGWIPQTFKYVKDEEAFNLWIASKPTEGSPRFMWTHWKESKPKERAIPQVTKAGEDGRELCESVEDLAEEVPEIRLYSTYNVVKHRISVLEGFKESAINGKVRARINGFTNTLRVKHAGVVNLPGVDKAYGEAVRGCLVAGPGKISCGSDMSSLEDRTKHHFMLPHDPEYVATMQADNYDPHVLMALTAKMITQEEFDQFMAGVKTDKVKAARKKGKTCLPTDNTEVLTLRGWLPGKEVVVGDYVMSRSNTTGMLEWSHVDNTVLYSDSEVFAMRNSSFQLESTADHRWVVERRTGRGRTRRKVVEYRTTEDLNKSCEIIVSAPGYKGFSGVTPGQAALVGWVLSDGNFNVSKLTYKTSQKSDGSRRQVDMSIAQNRFWLEVKTCLEDNGLSYKEYKNNSGVSVFDVPSPEARKFWESVGLELKNKHEIDYTSWILGLTPEAREAFFQAFWLADGATGPTGTRYATQIIYQNEGNIADAVALVSFLMGKTTLSNFRDGYGTIRKQQRSTVTMQKVVKEFSRTTEVFCLTTTNGNFVIRQNGFMTLTGNCNYASVYNAGAAKIAQAAGVSEGEGKILHTAYWELNWSVKAIAEEQVVIVSNEKKWLVNPINGFCYSLRKESDRFSTLAQGTGSFFFDMWVDAILTGQERKWGRKSLTGSFHDEKIIVHKDSPAIRGAMTKIISDAIDHVNTTYKLRRQLGCETQYGYRYSEIH